MRIAQVATLAASLSLLAGTAGAWPANHNPVEVFKKSPPKAVHATVGGKALVPAGFSLHKTWLFGHAMDGASVPTESSSKAGTVYVLNKPGIYRMTNIAAQGRYGFKGKGFVGDKIVVRDVEPAHITIR